MLPRPAPSPLAGEGGGEGERAQPAGSRPQPPRAVRPPRPLRERVGVRGSGRSPPRGQDACGRQPAAHPAQPPARQRSPKTPSGSSRGGVGGSPPLRKLRVGVRGSGRSPPGALQPSRHPRRAQPPPKNWTPAPSFATTGMARIVAGTPPALTRRCSSALLHMCRASPLGRRCASPPVSRASPARRRRQAGTGGEASFQRAAPRGFPPHKGRPRAALVAFSSSGGTSTATRPFASGSPSQGGQSE